MQCKHATRGSRHKKEQKIQSMSCKCMLFDIKGSSRPHLPHTFCQGEEIRVVRELPPLLATSVAWEGQEHFSFFAVFWWHNETLSWSGKYTNQKLLCTNNYLYQQTVIDFFLFLLIYLSYCTVFYCPFIHFQLLNSMFLLSDANFAELALLCILTTNWIKSNWISLLEKMSVYIYMKMQVFFWLDESKLQGAASWCSLEQRWEPETETEPNSVEMWKGGSDSIFIPLYSWDSAAKRDSGRESAVIEIRVREK